MKIQFLLIQSFLITTILFVAGVVSAQTIDLTKAEIIASDKIASPVRETAIRVLQEEVAKRTSINFRISSNWIIIQRLHWQSKVIKS